VNREPLAVVGIGIRLPKGITSPDDLWSALLEGLDGVGEVPADRWDNDVLADPDPSRAGSIKSTRGGFLDDIRGFDADYFGYFPNEAALLDPQQRILLEVAHEAFEDAGVPLAQLRGSRTAVVIGSFVYDYHCMQMETAGRDQISAYAAMGSGIASIANRVSYMYDLRGPSFTLDTYCSSSLVAVHQACQAIWQGDADAAVAGGVNAILRPEFSIALSKGGFLSSDGNCKAFSSDANGYVRSEGVGVVVLKPLARALADGDRVYASILGSAVNQDGFVPEGFTVPNPEAQVAMLRRAYAVAGVDPTAVRYVEAHGPGTVVGDPIEMRALGTVLGTGRGEHEPLQVGSIKTNFGHLEGASGIAGFIKAALVAHHGVAPPNLHLGEPNPAIDFRGGRLAVPTAATPLGGPALVGVNSFGAGGTNAHVVLRGEAPAPRTSSEAKAALRPFAVGAKTDEGLRRVAASTANFVRSDRPDLEDLSYSLLQRRTLHPRQVVVVADAHEALTEALSAVADGQACDAAAMFDVLPTQAPRLAFVYSGQGGQWPQMGLELMEQEPVFRSAMDDLDERFERVAGWSILEAIRRPRATSRIDDTAVVQPATMAIQVALTALYASWGVRPDAVVGHSIGEVAAAHAAGSIDLQTAAEIIYHRSRIQDRASGKGRMLAVGLSAAEAESLVVHEPSTGVATINGPRMVTLAGDAGVLERVAASLEQQEVFHRFLNVQVPYHSPFMDPLRSDLLEALGALTGSAAQIPLFSTVTAARASGEHLDAAYWFDNIRQPVRFTDTVGAMVEEGVTTFVEIGPHPVLVAGLKATLAEGTALAVGSMHKRKPSAIAVRHAMGAWLASGGQMTGSSGRFIDLPKYPWSHRACWFEPLGAGPRRRGEGQHPLFAGVPSEAATQSLRLSLDANPYLVDHAVNGTPILPGTAHLEIARAAIAAHVGAGPLCLREIGFRGALPLQNGLVDGEARLQLDAVARSFEIESRTPRDGHEPWTRHSTGRWEAQAPPPETVASFEAVRRRTGDFREGEADAFYGRCEQAGIAYGPRFQLVRELWVQGHEVIGRVALSPDHVHECAVLGAHPALLDAAIHLTFAVVHDSEEPNRHYLPHTVGRVHFLAELTEEVWSHVRVKRFDAQFLRGDIAVYNGRGELAVWFEDLACRHVPGARSRGVYDGLLGSAWQLREPGERLELGVSRVALVAPDPEDALARSLEDGCQALRLDPLRPTLPGGVLDARTQLVYLPALRPLDADADGGDLLESLLSGVEPLLELVKRFLVPDAQFRLTVVTRGAAAVLPHERPDLIQAPLPAMLRVLRNENPHLTVTWVDVGVDAGPEAFAGLRTTLFSAPRDADVCEVALRGEHRFVHVLSALEGPEVEQNLTVVRPASHPHYEVETARGAPLGFRARAARPPGPHEVAIDVHAVGLGEHDVAAVVAGGAVGCQLAGVVAAVGSAVLDVEAGAEVLALCEQGLAGRVLVPRDSVVRLPEGLGMERAAASVRPYAKAFHVVDALAQLRRGETVVVFGGASPDAVALVDVCTQRGATVLWVADTSASLAVLEALALADVVPPAPDATAGVVARVGEGAVDLVVDLVGGNALAPWVFRPFARAIQAPTDRMPSPLCRAISEVDNGSYRSFDFDGLQAHRPARLAASVAAVARHLSSGARPLRTVESFPLERLSEALSASAQPARHGPTVVTLEGCEVPVRPPTRVELRADRPYIVTGGTSGLGLALAQWLVDRGARVLVLWSRSGFKREEDEAVVADLRRRGAVISVESVDVGQTDAVIAAVHRTREAHGPLAGVLHCAGVTDDGVFTSMDRARFAHTLLPKAIGAWNLHRATEDAELDLFVLIASISSVLGMPGTTNYAGANLFVEALAVHRQARGLPATALSLGVLGEYAGLSRSTEANRHLLGHLQSKGLGRMRLEDVLDKLELTVAHGAVQRTALAVDWAQYRRANPHLLRDARVGALLTETTGEGRRGGGLRARLQALPLPEAEAFVTTTVQEGFARLVGLEASQVDVDVSLNTFGLDSIMMTELSALVLKDIGVDLPLLRLLRGPTLAELGADLVKLLGAAHADTSAPELGLSEADGVSFPSPWLIRGAGAPEAPVRVVAFHSMGVGASLFSSFLMSPPEGVDFLAVQTPGRESRRDEPIETSMDQLITRLLPEIRPLLDRPCLFWGHSFGGAVAFELSRRLRAEGEEVPRHLLVTGTAAPHLLRVWQTRDVLQRVMADDAPVEYLFSLSRYLEDPSFVEKILPIMKKDMPLLMSYRYREQPPLSSGITAVAARQDDMVFPDEIEAWGAQTTGSFGFHLVDGDHWFLHRHRDWITKQLATIAEGLR